MTPVDIGNTPKSIDFKSAANWANASNNNISIDYSTLNIEFMADNNSGHSHLK